jgi:hypothetical protein
VFEQVFRCVLRPNLGFLTDTPFQSSFGFGQIEGIAMVILPCYISGALDPVDYGYKQQYRVRALQPYKAMSDIGKDQGASAIHKARFS